MAAHKPDLMLIGQRHGDRGAGQGLAGQAAQPVQHRTKHMPGLQEAAGVQKVKPRRIGQRNCLRMGHRWVRGAKKPLHTLAYRQPSGTRRQY